MGRFKELEEVQQPSQATAELNEQEPIRLVVLAYPGTENDVRKAWERNFDLPFKVIAWPEEGASLRNILEDVMIDNEIAERFTVVPANLVPVTPVRAEEMVSAFVYVSKSGTKKYSENVPMTFRKEILTDFLPANDQLSDEDFVEKYIKEYMNRPNEVGFTFGNFITPVLRENPCENVIVEAFMHKRFVYANAVAWPVVWRLYESYLLSE